MFIVQCRESSVHFDGTGQELCIAEFIVVVGVRFLGLKIN
jgi:hypothetical protein